MARRKGEHFPSDDAKKKKRPHVTVDLTTRSHRIMGPAFMDPTVRGVVVGLWMLGRESWATATGDIATLTHDALCWVTGRQRPESALAELVRVARIVGYRIWIHGRNEPVPTWNHLRADLARTPCRTGTDPVRSRCQPGAESVPLPRKFGAVSIHIRNLAKKQHLTPAEPGESPRDPAPQEQEQVQEQVQSNERAGRAGDLAPKGVAPKPRGHPAVDGFCAAWKAKRLAQYAVTGADAKWLKQTSEQFGLERLLAATEVYLERTDRRVAESGWNVAAFRNVWQACDATAQHRVRAAEREAKRTSIPDETTRPLELVPRA